MQTERVKPTLKRTKFACVNCKAAKAACDSNRPCAWCIRHALQDSCVDAPRKVRTSKKICCDPSLHKNVVFKQEYKSGMPLSLAADFTPTTMIPAEPPLSPPSDIFAIEDLLAPSFDFGLSSNRDACNNCPLYQTCSKDAPQRLICATTSSPPQSPLSPEQLQVDEDVCVISPSVPVVSANFALPPMSLASHPDFGLLSKLVSQDPIIQAYAPQQECISTPTTPSTGLSLSLSQTSQVQSLPSTPQDSQQNNQQQQSQQQQQQQLQQQLQQQQIQQQLQQQLVSAQSRSLQGGCCSFATSPHLPPLLDDVCNCQSLVQREMAKINASLETISALMQLQNGPLIPTATFQVPDTTMVDCNDEFAKALGYENREDLFSSIAVDSLTISTKQMMKKEDDDDDDDDNDNDNDTPSQNKPPLTNLLPEKWTSGFLKCANDLQKTTLPLVNQMVFSSKRGDSKYFTVLIKPCGWFSYVSLLKQHNQMIEGLVVCGE